MTSIPDFDNWQTTSWQHLNGIIDFDWILAGGFALDLFADRNWRPHDDIDIIIKRQDQAKLLQSFQLDRLFVVLKPGTLSPMSPARFYQAPIQDIWVLNADLQSWMLQVMLVDVEDGHWVYKRNTKIRLLFDEIYFEKHGIKVLQPEIQLLYKSTSHRKKDDLDRSMITPLLSDKARQWLEMNLAM